MQRNNKHFFIQRILAILWLALIMTTACAGTPLWTFEPLTATAIAVPVNGTAMVQYRVTNQSSKSHTLIMQPILGITQITTGLNVCGNPFVLSGKGSSCILSLQINGSQLNSPVTDGPVVCQQGNQNRCYRPGSTNILHITRSLATGATITVNPSALNFIAGNNGLVTVTNSMGSPEPANNVVASIPGGSNISVQSTTCGAVLAIGASCTITFAAPAVEGPTNIDISGSNTNTATVPVTVTPVPIATISVNPTTLLFAQNSTGDVTVTNNAGSPVAAENVVATIPGGSNISVQSTTCGASLAIGASCTITFASGTQEGPTTIPIAGDNTNTVNVDVTVTSQPQISITNPVLQNRVVTVSSITPLSLEITNNAGSVVNANAITVSNKAACPNLSVDDSNCTSVAPGASCTLELTSNSPYAPCTITVSGSNTANSPTTLIAFSHLGGLVFQENAGSGKVVIDAAQGFNSQWTSGLLIIAGAASFDNGVANTNAIVVNTSCSNDTNNCAAQRCRNISADWYLPARNELSAVRSALCPNGAIPCNFGGFSSSLYWSSTDFQNGGAARVLEFPTGIAGISNKNNVRPVRCLRAFTP
ncbi:DUF1566 domain-containing protein [Legionella worsleiensis]|uniref:NHL repeat protein n=1 Tax=Legionella worsleiensis TaxID=45076 RepID=A0A0W1A5T6_9GAMM|nr:DUF1566 domain-containing protein [Legionella worsleiensis]KTD76717.1 NHL repeat protein [Legionella worsleiensis]STY30502.1 NHL repeat protein [Legionella worsleiensis]